MFTTVKDERAFRLFNRDGTEKQIVITYDKGTIKNSDIYSGSMEIAESLCSESELRFGSCEPSTFKIKVANIFTQLFGQWIDVNMYLEKDTENPFMLGRYKITSDKPTADRRYREIEAVDAMDEIINADVAEWYNGLLPTKESSVTMREFRDSFIRHFGLEQEEITLANDDMIVEKTIEPAEMSGKDVIESICEINACFGHITRQGKFRYVYLPQDIQGLYPENTLYPSDDLYPKDPKTTNIGENGQYISCQYEDFLTAEIEKLQVRQEENDIGAVIGEGDNAYIIEDNFLVYGKSAEELENIAKKAYGRMEEIMYRPYSAEMRGNPCFEVGDAIALETTYELVESYILQRTITGEQALRETISADGVEEYGEKVNSVQTSILQLKGKTNTLTRTVDETKSELKDTELELRSTITQTVTEIRSEVENARENLQSQITQNAESIIFEVSRAKETENELSSTITQTATEIKTEVNNVKDGLQSQITQNAGSISAEVSRATSAEGSLSSRLTITENGLSSKVDKNGIISQINQSAESVDIDASKISLNGYTSINGFFSVGTDGRVTIKDGTINLVTNGEDNRKITLTDGEYEIGMSARKISWRYSGRESIAISYLGGIDAGSREVKAMDFIEGGEYLSDKYQPIGNYATKTDITSQLSDYAKKSSLSGYFDGADEDSSTYGEQVTKYAVRDFSIRGSFSGGGKTLVGNLALNYEGASDIRLKDHITDMPDLSRVYMSLRLIRYKFKDDLTGHTKYWHYGISAQQLEDELAKLGITEDDTGVFYTEEPDPYSNESDFVGDDRVKMIRKDELHYMHMQMIQMQQRQIDMMNEFIMQMQSRIETLEEEVRVLKSGSSFPYNNEETETRWGY